MFKVFNALLKSRQPEINVIDKVWMSAEAKFNACRAMVSANPKCVFICWFQDTRGALKSFLNEEQLLTADRALSFSFEGRMIVFAEHHPLLRKEMELFKMLNLQEAPILSSLDEPLFMRFGGERTLELMKKLGMQENEVIGSNLITKAIRNAQHKIDKQVQVEREADSQGEWLNLNMPA